MPLGAVWGETVRPALLDREPVPAPLVVLLSPPEGVGEGEGEGEGADAGPGAAAPVPDVAGGELVLGAPWLDAGGEESLGGGAAGDEGVPKSLGEQAQATLTPRTAVASATKAMTKRERPRRFMRNPSSVEVGDCRALQPGQHNTTCQVRPPPVSGSLSPRIPRTFRLSLARQGLQLVR